MRTYIQPGNIIEVLVPAGGMEVGKGYVIGNLFGVAAETAAEPVTGFETSSLHVTGVFEFPNSDPVVIPGDKAYFRTVQGDINGGTPTDPNTYMIGVVVGFANNGAIVQVRLDGVAVTPGS